MANAGGVDYYINADTRGVVSGFDKAERSNEKLDKGLMKTDKSVKKLNTSFKSLSLSIGAALSVGAISKFVTSTAAAIDTQIKFADRIGASYEELQKLQFAASQTGVSVNSLNTGLQRMSRRLETVAQGGAPNVAKQLERMGLSIKDLQGLKPEQQIRVIADGFTRLSTDAERTTAAFALFDTEGVALVNTLKNGSSALDDYGNKLSAVGGVISTETARAAEEFNDQLDIMGRSLKGAGSIILSEMLPTLKSMNELIIDFIGNGDNVRRIIEGVGIAAQATAAVMAARLVVAIKATTISMAALGSAMGILGGPLGVLALVAVAAYNVAKRFDDAATKAARLKNETDRLVKSSKDLNLEQAKALALNTVERKIELEKQLTEEKEKQRKLEERGVRQQTTARGTPGALITPDQRELLDSKRRINEINKELEANGKVATSVNERIKELNGSFKSLGTELKIDISPEAGEGKSLIESMVSPLGDEGFATGISNAIIQENETLYEQLVKQRDLIREFQELEIGDAETHAKALAIIDDKIRQNKINAQMQLIDATSNFFGASAEMLQSFGKEQSNAYKAMFAIQKGFALAAAALALQQNIAEASKIGFPQNLPMIAGAVAQGDAILSTLGSINYGGGRERGGPVGANTMYQMGEKNKPEVLQTGAGLFAVPGDKGKVFNQSQLDQIQGGGGNQSNTFNINIENGDPDVVETAVKRAVAQVQQGFAQSMATKQGTYYQATAQNYGAGLTNGREM